MFVDRQEPLSLISAAPDPAAKAPNELARLLALRGSLLVRLSSSGFRGFVTKLFIDGP